MTSFDSSLRAGASWIFAAALLAGVSSARAQGASPPDASGVIAVETSPTPVSPLDLSPPRGFPAPAEDSAEIDYTPTGSTGAPTPAPTPNTPAPKREITHLDFAPRVAPEPTPSPLSSSASLSPAPDAAISPVVPAPREAKPAQDVNAAAPAVAATPLDLASAVEAAVRSLVAQTPSPNPLGAGNWRNARDAVRAFYAARQNEPVWFGAQGLTPAGRSALARLNRAAEDGLDLSAFELPRADFSDLKPERLAQAEATISAAVVAYAMQATGVRIVPTSISPLVTARPEVADPARVLVDVAAAADPGQTLAAYNPTQKGYQDLRDELARRRAAAPASAARPPSGPTLKIGMTDARVPLIRARFGLGAQGDPNAAMIYDARVASAVAAFQRSQGLAANGALTVATNEALFTDPSLRREASILANMEMWRWEPHDMGQTRVEVNVPDFSLRVMNGADEVHRARVIVGKPTTPTPIFSNEIKYILMNPVWHVPDSIIKKEMAPKLASDPDYLTRHGFKVTQVGDRLVVNQPSGAGNALGRILFMFPNEHAVYLHDTSARGLFASDHRALSHGCVRVEQPYRLAEIVMGGAASGWTAERVESMVGTSERWVFLPHPVPIHIEYFTEFVDENGAFQEREDLYGLTARVASMLLQTRQY